MHYVLKDWGICLTLGPTWRLRCHGAKRTELVLGQMRRGRSPGPILQEMRECWAVLEPCSRQRTVTVKLQHCSTYFEDMMCFREPLSYFLILRLLRSSCFEVRWLATKGGLKQWIKGPYVPLWTYVSSCSVFMSQLETEASFEGLKIDFCAKQKCLFRRFLKECSPLWSYKSRLQARFKEKRLHCYRTDYHNIWRKDSWITQIYCDPVTFHPRSDHFFGLWVCNYDSNHILTARC